MNYLDIDKINTKRLFESVLRKYDELGKPRVECTSMDVERCIPVTYAMFTAYLHLTREYRDYMDRLENEFGFPMCTYPSAAIGREVTSAMELAMFDMDNEYISFFIHDLEFGRKWRKGMVVNPKGEEIPLHTVIDLWFALINSISLKIQES